MTTRPRSGAVWTITPERPIWGSQRLVFQIELVRSRQTGRSLSFPEIHRWEEEPSTPPGRGQRDRPSGRRSRIPFGLEASRYSAAVSSPGFCTAQDRNAARRFSRGQRVAESHRCNSLETPGARATRLRHRPALRFADVQSWSCPTNRAWVGPLTSRCPAAARSCRLSFPGQHAPLGDRRRESGHPRFGRSRGVWSIALLGESRQPRVGLIWRTGASVSPLGKSLAASGFREWGREWRRLWSLSTRPQITVEGDVGGLRATSIARLEMARADWLRPKHQRVYPEIRSQLQS